MMTAEGLKDRIAARFPNAELVSDTAIRVVRTSNDRPFAVCYFDLKEEIPNDEKSLTAYLDSVVGPRYFDGSKSLQWNNYFYFVTTPDRLQSDDFLRVKKFVEADRRYARKFVIPESDIESVLSRVKTHTTPAASSNVFSIWMQELSIAGLDGVILSDDDVPTRLQKIASLTASKPTASTPITSQIEPPSFIREFEIVDYRPYPLERTFKFTSVNLIVGPNATGKTSLLEAIELYYCGKNKRNSLRPLQYEIRAVLADDRVDIATADRDLSDFRDRNLAWYGQAEVKTHNLDQSFAKFNFLNTDAAVDISDSTSDLEEDLSKLLIGPEASKAWQNMLRVKDNLESKLKDLRKLSSQTSEQIAEISKAMALTAETRQQSSILKSRLQLMMKEFNWTAPDGQDDVQWTTGLLATLTEFSAVIGQASTLGWLRSPVSELTIKDYCREADQRIPHFEQQTEVLGRIEREMRENDLQLRRDREVLTLLIEARNFIEAGVVERHKERALLQSTAAFLIGVLPESGIGSSNKLEFPHAGLPVGDAHRRALEIRIQSDRSLELAQKNHQNFAILRERAFNLTQQLRNTANEILGSQSNKDQCPLCHTQFPDGQLASHIASGGHGEVEQVAQRLLVELRKAERDNQEARQFETLSESILKFITAAGLSVGLTVADAAQKLKDAQQTLRTSQERMWALESEVSELEQKGWSYEKFQDVLLRLGRAGVTLEEQNAQYVSNCIQRYDALTSSRSVALATNARQKGELASILSQQYADQISSGQDLRVALSKYKESAATTKKIASNLSSYTSAFLWPQERTLAELLVSVNALRNAASELRVMLTLEKQAQDAASESSERKSRLEVEAEELRTQIDSFSRAYALLEVLTRDHPLHAAMQAALEQNRSGIEAVFLRIHSPQEFLGLGTTFSTLRRKNGGIAEITEISTGQRAAFALSIFLAQNSQLVGAPPVMLIDDPVAHIDDLNSLSLLDYLRDVAIEGKRQIFYATANEKIASLFERKFDFLGSEFSKIVLSRAD